MHLFKSLTKVSLNSHLLWRLNLLILNIAVNTLAENPCPALLAVDRATFNYPDLYRSLQVWRRCNDNIQFHLDIQFVLFLLTVSGCIGS
ncbi:hypothetical protein BCR44DRAFT_343330 [Catenaria anguillulae PL171]|uniref:Secreted protein n=1 Tax=Catenaria anguillulae PL171 TaxID=765915 RepID=A0A1Y2HLP8_9FUNG|nr:hypothetical protein BCR44DRAFT_343330 [Catenaria anguillulae PL171]